jgi:hypothetical protein
MDYEFNEQQDRVIAGMVTWVRATSIALFALAAFKTALIFWKGEIGNIAYSIFTTVLAVWLWQLGAAFNLIASKTGDDSINLVSGFQALKKTMNGIRLAQILMLAILLIIFVLGVLAAIATISALAKH